MPTLAIMNKRSIVVGVVVIAVLAVVVWTGGGMVWHALLRMHGR